MSVDHVNLHEIYEDSWNIFGSTMIVLFGCPKKRYV